MALQTHKEIIELKKYISEKVAKELDLQKALLFGSYAKNTQHEYSDIDIALISSRYKDCDYLTEAVKAMDLFEEYDCRVEPHLFAPEEIEFNNDDGFVKEIFQTGIVLYST